jgi:hypothetical protein
MRLTILERGRYRPLQKLQFFFIRALVGDVPGPILMMSYRREFFGKYLARCFQEAMRVGEWSSAETEIFAAFVSKLGHCEF